MASQHCITMGWREQLGVAEQLLEPGWVGAQRAPGRPPAQRWLKARAVLPERGLVDDADAAAAELLALPGERLEIPLGDLP